jgi:hypothetical protein
MVILIFFSDWASAAPGAVNMAAAARATAAAQAIQPDFLEASAVRNSMAQTLPV